MAAKSELIDEAVLVADRVQVLAEAVADAGASGGAAFSVGSDGRDDAWNEWFHGVLAACLAQQATRLNEIVRELNSSGTKLRDARRSSRGLVTVGGRNEKEPGR